MSGFPVYLRQCVQRPSKTSKRPRKKLNQTQHMMLVRLLLSSRLLLLLLPPSSPSVSFCSSSSPSSSSRVPWSGCEEVFRFNCRGGIRRVIIHRVKLNAVDATPRPVFASRARELCFCGCSCVTATINRRAGCNLHLVRDRRPENGAGAVLDRLK